MAGALVVGVGVRERVGRQGASAQLAQDPPLGLARRGVDQHVAREVDVDRVGREALQLEHAVREVLHPGTVPAAE